jgi:hypothetical protein
MFPLRIIGVAFLQHCLQPCEHGEAGRIRIIGPQFDTTAKYQSVFGVFIDEAILYRVVNECKRRRKQCAKNWIRDGCLETDETPITERILVSSNSFSG